MGEVRDKLRDELLRWMRGEERPFEPMARRLYQYQSGWNAPYRAYCEALGITADRIQHWGDIPAVPAEAFKSELRLACFPPEETIRTFRTSGTTGEVRGRHEFRDLTLYEASIVGGWRRAGLPFPANAFFAARPPGESPDSSLAHMFATLCPDDLPQRWLATAGGGFNAASLQSMSETAGPVLLLGTTLALLHLCESTEALPLPAGSRVFQTGGSKGVETGHDPEAATAAIRSHFAVPPDAIINEYGMTELTSQCYALGADAVYRTPPWLRVRVIDPASGEEVAPGEVGYLVLYDLANLDSVLAVRTRDVARCIDASRFELLQRDPSALPRGCSRASDAYFTAAP